jgi:hypothetical protein
MYSRAVRSPVQPSSTSLCAPPQGMPSLRQYLAGRSDVGLTTLGPAGTSSEYAASAFYERNGCSGALSLVPSYEQAAEAVISRQAEFLLVANAYDRINRFYINDSLVAVDVYPLRTPGYAVAVLPNSHHDACDGPPRVASHPAPAHILHCAFGRTESDLEIVAATSTSAAAELVSQGSVPACLTTDIARRRNRLAFVTRPKPIRMLWTVFARVDHPAANTIFGEDVG